MLNLLSTAQANNKCKWMVWMDRVARASGLARLVYVPDNLLQSISVTGSPDQASHRRLMRRVAPSGA